MPSLTTPVLAWLAAMSATARLNAAYWTATISWWRAFASAQPRGRRARY